MALLVRAEPSEAIPENLQMTMKLCSILQGSKASGPGQVHNPFNSTASSHSFPNPVIPKKAPCLVQKQQKLSAELRYLPCPRQYKDSGPPRTSLNSPVATTQATPLSHPSKTTLTPTLNLARPWLGKWWDWRGVIFPGRGGDQGPENF